MKLLVYVSFSCRCCLCVCVVFVFVLFVCLGKLIQQSQVSGIYVCIFLFSFAFVFKFGFVCLRYSEGILRNATSADVATFRLRVFMPLCVLSRLPSVPLMKKNSLS